MSPHSKSPPVRLYKATKPQLNLTKHRNILDGRCYPLPPELFHAAYTEAADFDATNHLEDLLLFMPSHTDLNPEPFEDDWILDMTLKGYSMWIEETRQTLLRDYKPTEYVLYVMYLRRMYHSPLIQVQETNLEIRLESTDDEEEEEMDLGSLLDDEDEDLDTTLTDTNTTNSIEEPKTDHPEERIITEAVTQSADSDPWTSEITYNLTCPSAPLPPSYYTTYRHRSSDSNEPIKEPPWTGQTSHILFGNGPPPIRSESDQRDHRQQITQPKTVTTRDRYDLESDEPPDNHRLPEEANKLQSGTENSSEFHDPKQLQLTLTKKVTFGSLVFFMLTDRAEAAGKRTGSEPNLATILVCLLLWYCLTRSLLFILNRVRPSRRKKATNDSTFSPYTQPPI